MNTHPPWLKKRLSISGNISYVKRLLSAASVNTVCEESLCPNMTECYSKKFLTFLILGRACSRACGFCSVGGAAPEAIDPEEPGRIVRVISELGLKYVIITSVTRDDLEDGGAGQFANVIKAVRGYSGNLIIEALVPDFKGDAAPIRKVLDACPDIFGHNIETVKRLYRTARSNADYDRSLQVLRLAKDTDFGVNVKSGMMVGLGETRDEVIETMNDLKAAGCDLLTIGQYLSPGRRNLKVERFVSPSEFSEYRRIGKDMGFRHVAAGPFVRSSYMAEEGYEEAISSPVIARAEYLARSNL